MLRHAFQATGKRWPFTLDAIAVMPDHVHTVWSLPDGDADFSTRWSFLKSTFTRHWIREGGGETPVSESRRSNRRRGVWQRRFWEHSVRDDPEYERICDYIHYNPVKHGLVPCPHEWPYSSFHRFARAGFYPADWMCACGQRTVRMRAFEDVASFAGE